MSRKRRSEDPACHMFNPEWGVKYFVVQSGNSSLCLICNQTLGAFKEDRILRHYETEHEDTYSQFTGQQRTKKFKLMERSARAKENEVFIKASYKVAYELAKEGKPSTYAEVVKACLIREIQQLCPEKINLCEQVDLDPDTIACRFEDIRENIVKQMAEKARGFQQYSIALDESDSHLLVFIRGLDRDFNVTEELASVYRMSGRVTGEGIFNYLEKTLSEYGLEWSSLKCVTIGEGKNISGAKRGLMERIASAAEAGGFSEPMVLHCAIHQLALCGEQVEISRVLEPAISIVNYIRSSGRDRFPFREFLEEADSASADLSDYRAVRWLKYGKVLSQFFQLREEIKSFLEEENRPEATLLSQTDWLCKLAFCVDLTDHMNQLCLKLKGATSSAINVFSHVIAFRAQLIQCMGELQRENLDHFPCAAKFREESQAEFPSSFAKDLIENLQEQFSDFDGKADEIKMLQNPFDGDGGRRPVPYYLEILFLKTQAMLMGNTFRGNDLFPFYKSLPSEEFPNLKQLACGYLSIFGTCPFEEKFSKKYLQSQNRANLSEASLKSVLIIGSSGFQPQFDEIFQLKHQLPSGSASP